MRVPIPLSAIYRVPYLNFNVVFYVRLLTGIILISEYFCPLRSSIFDSTFVFFSIANTI